MKSKTTKLLFVRVIGLILALLALPVVWFCTALKFIAEVVIFSAAVFNVKYYIFFGDYECASAVFNKVKDLFDKRE